MEPEPIKKRLDALDGLRGIAIILVLLSHLNLTVLFDKGSNIVLKTIFDSGEIGVSILFILSGFLMAYLYPNPKSKMDFLQKRYTRIFPAFIAVCVLLTAVSLNPQIIDRVPDSLIWLTTIALGFHFVWVYIIKKLPASFGKLLFRTFLLLQVIIGSFYLFWVMRMDYSTYIDTVPEITRAAITFLVNATLTLPLGTYSGPLSSVYWSLGTEVYFYILYPVIAVPFISLASRTNRILRLILLASTLPLFIGLYLISQKFLFFNLLHLELAYYFVGGLALGYLYRTRTFNFDTTKMRHKLLSRFSISLFIGTIIIYHLLLIALPSSIDPYLKTVFTLPITSTILLVLFEHTNIQKVLNNKVLIFIGTISYSMYLIHMFIFDVVKKQLGDPTDSMGVIFYILVSVLATILVSYGMYYALEKPYFKKRKSGNDAKTNNEVTSPTGTQSFTITKLLIVLTIIYGTTTFFAYNSDFKLFSLQSRHKSEEILLEPKITEDILLNKHPKIAMQLTAQHNNLAVIEFDLKGSNIPNQVFRKQTITARIAEQGTNNWQETKLMINSRDDTMKNLFGFSPIPDSKNKIYNLEIILDEPNSSHQITINTANKLMTAHYTINKSAITNPDTLITLGINKLTAITTNPTAQVIFLLYVPFLLTGIYLIKKK